MGIRDGLLRPDPTGFSRAGAIIAGLFFTTAGYLAGILSRAPDADKEHIEAITPVQAELKQEGVS
jgi:hypothetical protein